MANEDASKYGPRTFPEKSQNQTTVHHDFGLADSRGRLIGTFVTTFEQDFVPYIPSPEKNFGYMGSDVAAGHYFCYQPHASRNGNFYGACQDSRRFATAAERDASILKYLDGARKRASKLSA